MDDPVTVRRATPDDVEAVCDLLREVFPDNPKQDPRVLRWQYWRNPFGPSASCVAVTEDGGVVGHAGAFATPGRLGGVDVVLGHTADAAVAPGRRGRGLFTRLATARRDAAADADYALTITLPNERSLAPNRRAGLRVVARARVTGTPTRPEVIARRLHLPTRVVAAATRRLFHARTQVRGGDLQEVADPGDLDDDVDALYERSRSAADNGVRRDAAWFRWRYLEHPDRPYRVVGLRRDGALHALAAVRSGRRHGPPLAYVMDLLARTGGDAARLLREVADRLDDEVAVVALALPGARTGGLLHAAGLRRLPRVLEPSPMRFGLLDAVQSVDDHLDGHWTMSWSDHDHL